MKKLLTALMAAALLAPGIASAQTYYYRTEGPVVRTSSIYQDHVRITDDRATLSADQDILARDRAFGNWWAISGDVARVRQDRAQLQSDVTSYDADRGMPVRTYTYRYIDR